MSAVPLIVSRRQQLSFCLVILLFLNIGNAAAVYALHVMGKEFAFGVVPLFNFNIEANLPSLFNGVLLGMASAIAFGISRSIRQSGQGGWAFSWKAVGGVLLFLMLDELCRIHEALDWILMDRVRAEGAISWPWVIPYGVLAVLVAGFFLRFFFSLQAKYRWCFAISAAVYVVGAIGFELLEAAHTAKHGMKSLGFGILYTIEENLEMIAVMIANWGFMGYAIEHCKGIGTTIVIES